MLCSCRLTSRGVSDTSKGIIGSQFSCVEVGAKFRQMNCEDSISIVKENRVWGFAPVVMVIPMRYDIPMRKDIAEKTGLKQGEVKSVMESMFEIASTELKKTGSFKLGGMLNMKLKNKPATKARKGKNPFTGEPCVFKAKPASKTVRVLPLKKLKDSL